MRSRTRRRLALPALAGVELPRTLRQRVLWLPGVLWMLAGCLLAIGIARPRLEQGRVTTTTEAVAIQIVMDRSASMKHEMQIDGSLRSRIDVVKGVLRDFLLGDGKELKGRVNDLVGLVTFARFAETNCPLVRDPATVVQLIDSVELAQQRYEDGTAIGDGLALAAARLRSAEQDLKSRQDDARTDASLTLKSKVIVLITDGDNNAGQREPLDAARLAAEWGIRVHTIGVGGAGWRVIRTPFGEERVPIGYEIDEQTLGRIAEIGGGIYRRAADGDSLRRIYAEIDRMERSEVRTVDSVEYRELFEYPAMAAAILIATQLLLSTLVLRRLPA